MAFGYVGLKRAIQFKYFISFFTCFFLPDIVQCCFDLELHGFGKFFQYIGGFMHPTTLLIGLRPAFGNSFSFTSDLSFLPSYPSTGQIFFKNFLWMNSLSSNFCASFNQNKSFSSSIEPMTLQNLVTISVKHCKPSKKMATFLCRWLISSIPHSLL